MKSIVSPEHHLLRANVESSMQTPSVILVTSARPGDGKSVTAYGLAQSLAQAGHRVAVIDAVGERSRGSVERLRTGNTGIANMTFQTDGPRSSRGEIGEYVRNLRDAFDYAIVDGVPLMTSSGAVLLANAVDGILLTFRVGRRSGDDDVLMTQMLCQCKARLLGAVAVTSERIASFRPDDDAVRSTEKVVFAHAPENDEALVSASMAH